VLTLGGLNGEVGSAALSVTASALLGIPAAVASAVCRGVANMQAARRAPAGAVDRSGGGHNAVAGPKTGTAGGPSRKRPRGQDVAEGETGGRCVFCDANHSTLTRAEEHRP
jgi:hypothetical protein